MAKGFFAAVFHILIQTGYRACPRKSPIILLEQEKAELEAEERARAKSKGMGDFLSTESKKVFGGAGGIEERIRRGRGQMHVDTD